MELWEPIKGMEGHYKVSNLGRIKSLKRIKRQWNGYKYIEYEISEKIRKPRYFNGYYIVNLTVNGVRYQEWVHRLVAQAFIPNPNNLPEVDHKNGRKLDNRANNLRWVTKEDNMRYMQARQNKLKTKKFETKYGKNSIVTKTSSNNGKTKVLHLETGKLYTSSRQAGKDLNLSDANIRRSCKTNGRSAVKGNHFRYVI